jgi:predicted Fe-Mo cluster-binding NifX family protein
MSRIAVASDDGENIAQHFGRCRMFLIYEVDESGYRRCVVRVNEFTGHSKGECGDSTLNRFHHTTIIEGLKNCVAVISRGMGRRAMMDLKQAGIKPLFITRETNADGALEDYIAGRLSEDAGACPGHRD